MNAALDQSLEILPDQGFTTRDPQFPDAVIHEDPRHALDFFIGQ